MTATAIKQQPVSRLGQVRSGTLKEPLRYLFYGAEGVGKSTLAAGAPNPIMFDVEGGSSMIDVSRYSFSDGPHGTVPTSFRQIMSGIADLGRSEHEFKTLILDALGAVEALIWGHVCARGDKKNIEEFGFGKGYSLAVDEFRNLCHSLDRLRQAKGMEVILIGHSTVKMFKNPIDDDYDRFNIRLNGKSSDFIRGWADIIGYCSHEDGTKEDDKTDRVKGYSTGRRLMHLDRTAGYDAKSRVPMPSEVELEQGDSWGPFADLVAAGRDTSDKELIKQIKAELARIDDEKWNYQASKRVKSAGSDTSKLAVILNKLKEQSTQSEESK